MRTKTLLAAAAMLAAGLASSMAQSNVYSLNVVGYVNKVMPSGGKYIMISNPLNTTSNTINSLLSGAAVGSQFLKFSGGGFQTVSSKLPGAWTIDYTLNLGEGGFFRTPSASTVDYTNTFVGEVLQGDSTNNWPAGYSIIAYPEPLGGDVNALGLTTKLAAGDQVLQFDAVAQTYVIRTVLNPAGGVYSGPTPVVDVAESFFVRAATAGFWSRNFTVQ